MRKVFLSLSLVGLLCLSGIAQASFITGDIGFGGSLKKNTDLATTTVIDFDPQQAIVTSATDDFLAAGVAPFATLAIFTDFNTGSLPVTPLWALTAGLNSFSFDLISIVVGPQTASSLGLTGEGFMHGTGFSDTPYSWSFSADRVPLPNGTFSKTVSFSATNATSTVPEPGTVMLLGTGLFGIGLTRWLRNRKA